MKLTATALLISVVSLANVSGFGLIPTPSPFKRETSSSTLSVTRVACQEEEKQTTDSPLAQWWNLAGKSLASSCVVASVCWMTAVAPTWAAASADLGATAGSNAKITTGGASTLQSGRTIAITRGVIIDRADFSGQNLKGVAFQQSIVRDASFKNCNLVGASFFDATLDGSDFENADMSLSNVEMAQFARANLKNAVLRELYVSGATSFENIKNIEGSDWSETYLRADQKKLLCNHPTAKGTNPVTGVDTRESLMCPN